MKFLGKVILLLFFILLCTGLLSAQNKFFVNGSIASSGQGYSWGDAFSTVQEAINAASPGDSVFVAATSVDNPYKVPAGGLKLKNGILLYGGFLAKTGTSISYLYEQNAPVYITILDAEQKGRVLFTEDGDSTTVCSGFTLVNGQATVDGGGVFLTKNGILEKCIIKNNSAKSGGGIYNEGGKIIDCVIAGNTSRENGGGVYNKQQTIINCAIFGNKSSGNGGGVYTTNGEFVNCTLADNLATSQGGGVFSVGTTSLKNSIVWNNKASAANNIQGNVKHSFNLVEGVSIALGEIVSNSDPLFVYPQEVRLAPFSTGNYSLLSYSPAINTGNDENLPQNIINDVAGKNRRNGTTDIGAYEYQQDKVERVPDTLYVNINARGTSDGINWTNAMTSLSRAIKLANNYSDVKNILIAEGTYKPEYVAGSGSSEQDKSFSIERNDLLIQGGFRAGDLTPSNKEVRLSGYFLNTQSVADSVCHVVICVNNNDKLRLENLIMMQGSAKGNGNILVGGATINRNNGGGIYITNSSCVLENIQVKNNRASNSGGGMYIDNSAPKISGTTISLNKALKGGGSYHVNASSAAYTDRSRIENNTSFLEGGGIYNSNSELNMKNVFVNANKATGDGGGIYSDSSSDLVLNNSTLKGNSSSAKGGGIYITGGNFEIENIDISENKSTHNGGGIYSRQSTGEIINGSFRANQSVNENGGAIFNDDLSVITTKNNLLSGNRSKKDGGALYNSGKCFITNNSISGNLADEIAGGIFNQLAANIEIRNSIIWGNEGKDPLTKNIINIPVSSFYHCAVENETISGPNITHNDDPLFSDNTDASLAPTLSGTYTLLPYSPVIDEGDNTYIVQGEVDILGNPRIYQNIKADLGAYEYQGDSKGIPDTLFVDHTAVGTFDGINWSNAMNSLSRAIGIANSYANVKNILVAKGTYYPASTGKGIGLGARDKSFLINRGNLKLEGGYPNEGEVRIRDIYENPVIMNGDLNKNAVADNNDSYHVLVTIDADNTLVIDGFTVRGGIANAVGNSVIGGKTINRSLGGGMYNLNSSPVLNNLIISYNYSSGADGGAGIYNYSSSPVFTNTIITNNSKINGGGNGAGVTNNNYSNPEFYNVTIGGNKAANAAGVYNMNNSSAEFYNSILSDNLITSTAGKEIVNTSGGKASFSYSMVRGAQTSGSWDVSYGDSDGTNIDSTDPLFINPAQNDYRLLPYSLLIDKGNKSYISLTDFPYDLSNCNRVMHGEIDLGAYESQVKKNFPTKLYVNQSAESNEKDGLSWSTAMSSAARAIKMANEYTLIDSIFIAEGDYFPEYSADLSYRDRTESFLIKRNGLSLIGGYSVTNNIGIKSNFNTHPVVFSGAVGKNKSYHTLVLLNVDNTLTIEGISITDGNANGVNTASAMTIDGITIVNTRGAGIYMQDANPKMKDIIVSANEADSAAGIYFNNSSPEIINLTATDNNSKKGNGAALYITGNSSPSITNGSIYDNTTLKNGGGIFIDGNNSNPDFINLTISGNRAESGGGVYNKLSAAKITNTIIWGNEAGTFKNIYGNENNISFSLVEGIDENLNWDLSFGKDMGNNIVGDPLFVDPYQKNYQLLPYSKAVNNGNNTVISESFDLAGRNRKNEGVVDMGAYECQLAGMTTIPKTLYVDQAADGNMTGITWTDAMPSLARAMHLAESHPLVENILVAKGIYYPEYKPGTGTTDRDKAFFLSRSNLKVEGGYDTAGSSRDITNYPVVMSGDLNKNNGYDNNDTYHVLISVGTDNTLIFDGIAITGANAYINTTDSIVFKGAEIKKSKGGGIYNVNSSAQFNNVSITRNRAYHSGGGIYNEASSPQFTQLALSGNTVYSHGAGMYNCDNSTVLIKNSLFTGNHSSNGMGGAISNENSSTVITKSNISANNRAVYGGGIYNNNSSLTINDSTVITGNNATGSGGGIYNESNSDTELISSVISNNSATNTGGGITVLNSKLTVSASVINANNRAKDGAAIYNSSSILLINDSTLISGNNASNAGGGLYTESGSQVEIDFSVISSNNATVFGGGIYSAGSSLSLNNITVQQNSSSDGGGMYNNQSDVELLNNRFVANRANNSGGAILNNESSPIIINSLVSGNVALNNSGGGLYNNKQSSPKLINTTMSRNYAKSHAGGLYNDSQSSPVIQNTIIWGNTVSQDTGGENPNIYNVDGLSKPDYTYSLIEGSSLSWENIGNDLGNNIDEEPLFHTLPPVSQSPSLLGNYELLLCSPAVNKGNNDYIPHNLIFDLKGENRIYDALVDLGAFELQDVYMPNKIELIPDTVIYTGLNQSIDLSQYPQLSEVEYEGINGTDYPKDTVAPVNAGEYEVSVVFQPEDSRCPPVNLLTNLVILKAPQQIEFTLNPPVAILEDGTYALSANSSSGLPVSFVSSNVLVAELYDESNLKLNSTGLTIITASQSGDNNYLPADVIALNLEVVSRNVSLSKLIIQGEEQDPELRHYLMDCEDDSPAATVRVEAFAGAVVTPQDTIVDTNLPVIHTIPLYVLAQDGITDTTYYLKIEKRFKFNEIILKKWENTLIVNNNSEANGGYNFVSYRWFKDNEGDNEFYVVGHAQTYSATVPSTNSQFYVEVTTEDGYVLKTCPEIAELIGELDSKVFPNPVTAGEAVKIRLNYTDAELENARYYIYSVDGKLIKQGKITNQLTDLVIAEASGKYILKIIVDEFLDELYNIIVK